MSENTQVNDDGVKEFLVGGQPRELTFSAAIRFRLFLNIPVDQVQDYVVSDNFKLTALALLLGGKEAKNFNYEQTLDLIEDQGLTNGEMEAIIGWVRGRALDFMLAEATQTAQALEKVLPKATELSNSLTGS